MEFPLELNYRYSESQGSGPDAHGVIRSSNADFQVDELLGFELAGEGEHLYLNIRKNGQNTRWVKDQMAIQLGINPRDIGHAGLKDRYAITTQWLSIYAPSNQPHLDRVDIEGLSLLDVKKHRQKLKPGMHLANRFRIRLNQFSGEKGQIDRLAQKIEQQGFPNYFGEQRFGIDGGNLAKGWQLLQSRRLSRHKNKSIYLSALRSFLFNRVLSARLARTDELAPSFGMTGPLWGRGRLSIPTDQQDFEKSTLGPWSDLCEALEYSGLNQERRDLFVVPDNFSWTWISDSQLELEFQLPPGTYATSLLRELAKVRDAGGNTI